MAADYQVGGADRNGDPVEFSPAAIGVGKPGDIVLMARPQRGPDGAEAVRQ